MSIAEVAALTELQARYDSLLLAARETEKALEHAESELADIKWPEGGDCAKGEDCRVCHAREDIGTALAYLRDRTGKEG